MKSIQTRFLTIIISGMLILAVAISVISVAYISTILNEDSDIITESVANTEALRINQQLRDVEHTAAAVETYISSTVGSLDELKDPAYRAEYNEILRNAFFAAASKFEGNLAFYLRYDSEISSGIAEGFFLGRASGNATFTDIEMPTTAAWEASDRYTVPKNVGAPAWLEPYTPASSGNKVISYVMPIYVDSHFVAVIGVDFDFSVISSLVSGVSVYDNGFAYLADTDGKTVYFSPVDDHMLDRTHKDHGFAEEHMELINGMCLIIHADYSDIQRDSYKVVTVIVLIVVALIAIFILITYVLTKKIIHPLKQITAAAGMLADGKRDLHLDDCRTSDEVGVLAAAFEKTAEKLHGYMDYVNKLAYKDSLTGLRNLAAYTEASAEVDGKIKLGHTEPFAILVADINYLKTTNDKYGHEIGNKLIIRAAKIISDVFKHSPVYRIGGDEFLVFLRGEDLEASGELITKLDERCAESFIICDQDKIPVSIARAVEEYDSRVDISVEDVFSRADHKMYEHKNITR